MQQSTAMTNPTQLYPQTVPGLRPAPTQQQQATQTSQPTADPNTTSLPTGSSANIPDTNLVKTQLANSKAVPIGIKYGLIFGALGSLPIWGIEKWSKERNLIQQLVHMGETSFQSTNFPWSRKLVESMKNPLLSFATSAAGTISVGVVTGATLGWWNVKHIKEKLTDINTMKQEQQAGTFQPKPLSLMQRLGIAKKSTNSPDQDYQDLLQNNLNQAHAFKQGAWDITAFKLAPALALWGAIGAGLLFTRQFNRASYQNIINNEAFKDSIKTILQPVFIAKFAALPVIGGLIAKQIVPWAKQQLHITDPQAESGQNNATIPGNESSPLPKGRAETPPRSNQGL